VNDVIDRPALAARARNPIRIQARDRRMAALHEAGHVVMADRVNRGKRVTSAGAVIFPNTSGNPDEKTWIGKTDSWHHLMTPLERRLVACAGYAAEVIWDGGELDPDFWLFPEAMSPTDWAMAECEPGEIDDLCCDAIETLALLLNRDGPFWPKVLREARHLIEYSREAAP
jgi:hypothetical protein